MHGLVVLVSADAIAKCGPRQLDSVVSPSAGTLPAEPMVWLFAVPERRTSLVFRQGDTIVPAVATRVGDLGPYGVWRYQVDTSDGAVVATLVEGTRAIREHAFTVDPSPLAVQDVAMEVRLLRVGQVFLCDPEPRTWLSATVDAPVYRVSWGRSEDALATEARTVIVPRLTDTAEPEIRLGGQACDYWTLPLWPGGNPAAEPNRTIWMRVDALLSDGREVPGPPQRLAR